jgi:signal transduction histidine kinase
MSTPVHKVALPILDRLTTKVAIAAVVFLFALATAIIFLIESGFRRNQYGAYSSSQIVLEEQLRAALVQSISGQVRFIDARLREDGQPITRISNYFPQFQTLSEDAFYLTDGKDYWVSTASDDFQMQVIAAQKAITTDSTVSLILELQGNPYLLISIPLSEPGWRLLVAIPAQEIENQSKRAANAVWADAEATIRSTLSMLFLVFLAALLVTLILFDRLINSRITELVKGVQAVTKGDLSVRVPVNPADELGLLGQSYNEMTAEIRRRGFELLQMNNELRESEEMYRNLAQSLEVRVEESTREIKHLYQQAATRSQELEVLYQADEQLYRHLLVNDVLQALVDVVTDKLGADKSSVMVWDEGSRQFRVRAARGFSASTLAILNQYQPGDGISGRVFQTGEIITLEDAASSPPPANLIAASEGICSVISVPIMIKAQTFGVFGMNYCQPRRFSQEDIRLFQALAQRAAIAIENARLYEQAQQAAILEERQRLARELHDAITQLLYSLVLLAEAGRRHAAAGNLDHVEHHLSRLGDTAQQALKEMRLLVYELRPLALAEIGLGGAIRQRLDAVEKRAGIQVRFYEEGVVDLPPAVEEQIYRLVQEALNNILKHADANHVSVHLRARAGLLNVEIRDDGKGFSPEQSSGGGFGLSSMRERAERIGSELVIESAAGRGTRIALTIHLDGVRQKLEGAG